MRLRLGPLRRLCSHLRRQQIMPFVLGGLMQWLRQGPSQQLTLKPQLQQRRGWGL